VAITAKRAEQIEVTLRELGLEPQELHDWIMRRIYAADGDGRPVTRYRRVRGSHGETYLWDPDGTDDLPAGYEAPRPQ
jgi:hypothetical protein